MKKIILITILATISVASFSHQLNPVSSLDKQGYLNKSRSQKTAGWIFLGSGFVFGTSGIFIGINGSAEEIAGIFTGEKSNKLETGAILFSSGLALMLGSIPLFTASSRNKKKASNLSFKNERAPQISKQKFVYSSTPSVSLKINL